jgi:hypothetical protein
VGNASGITPQNFTIQLSVTGTTSQAGPFALSISATSFLVLPNNHLATNPIITLTRQAGFTGSVAFSVTGLPPTLFVGFTPSTTTGSTTTAIVVSVGAANGTYVGQIRGASTQGDQTIPFQIVVASANTGTVKWKWCSSSLPRFFVAVKDGSGPWTRLKPADDSTYSFNLSSPTAQLAEVTLDSGGFRTTIHQYTAQEMTARGSLQCRLGPNLSARTVTGSFAGVAAARTALVGMGFWSGAASGSGNFTLLNLPAGPLDAVAARNGTFTDPSAIPVDGFVIRRGLNPASGASIGVLDFNGQGSFAPTTAQWTFLNTNGQSFGVSQTFTTAGGSTGVLTTIPGIDGNATTRSVYGVPLAQTVTGDLHQVIATVTTSGVVNNPVRATRQIVYYGRTLGVPDTLTFGPTMPAATVSVVAPGYLRAQGTLPAEYNTGVAFDVTQSSTARFYTIHTTRGFLGAGNTYSLEMPDLSAVLGWDTQYNLRAGVGTNWSVSGGGPTLDFFDARNVYNSLRSQWAGAQTGMAAPVDGATYLMGRTFGNATP